MAFLKSMEEANKFLPTNNTLLIDLDAITDKPVPRGFTGGRVKMDGLEAETGRNSKLMMPEQEETSAREMFDKIMLHGYEICMKGVEDLRIAMGSEAEKSAAKAGRGRRSTSEAVDLRTMLIHCAQAVAAGDHRSANELLTHESAQRGRVGSLPRMSAMYCREFAEDVERESMQIMKIRGCVVG